MKFHSGVTGLLLASFLLVPGVSFAQAAPTVSTLQAQINALLAEVASLQQQLAGGSTSGFCYNFDTNLYLGTTGSAITALQTGLQKDGESVTVNGSFDDQTASAVTGFQEKYASSILAPIGLKNGTGYVGSATRGKLNALFGCGSAVQPPVICPAFGCGVVPTPIVPTPVSTPSGSLSLSSVSPSSGLGGTTVTLTGNGFLNLPTAVGGDQYGDGVWISDLAYSSFISHPTILSNTSLSFVVPISGCPGIETQTCSSNFAQTLPSGIYSVYAKSNNGTVISNKLTFTLNQSLVSQGQVQITSPSTPFGGLITFAQGQLFYIGWSPINTAPAATIILLQNGIPVVSYGSVPDNGSYAWTAPTNLSGSNFQMEVTVSGLAPGITNPFSIGTSGVASLPGA